MHPRPFSIQSALLLRETLSSFMKPCSRQSALGAIHVRPIHADGQTKAQVCTANDGGPRRQIASFTNKQSKCPTMKSTFSSKPTATPARVTPYTLGEDFCGTFAVSCQWVKSDKERTAIGIDLCPTTLQWGRDNNLSKLDAEQQKRVTLKRTRRSQKELAASRHPCRAELFVLGFQNTPRSDRVLQNRTVQPG